MTCGEECLHGVHLVQEPCPDCYRDMYEANPEIPVEEICASIGHPYYRDDRRCYCGARDDRNP